VAKNAINGVKKVMEKLRGGLGREEGKIIGMEIDRGVGRDKGRVGKKSSGPQGAQL
jgi:hypothetical protein